MRRCLRTPPTVSRRCGASWMRRWPVPVPSSSDSCGPGSSRSASISAPRSSPRPEGGSASVFSPLQGAFLRSPGLQPGGRGGTPFAPSSRKPPPPGVLSMRYIALACDYDGTIAHHGKVDEPTLAALERVKASGRKLLLVSGRELEDLQATLPHLGIFDW